ncbi:MAG: RdgB/HAM1 family non-canonical purine NTP pyrophosphatase [Gammaproteobacteria bacterium]|nr:RdgB/HAM1 family non-canonical purine NTP pyrophosphatase [Gammaproteobacteria bacterium]
MSKTRIVLASGNQGKIKEFQHVLAQAEIELVSQASLNVEEAEETGLSFVENAILKARNAARATGLPSIADDSGLEVDALKGAPGIYSSRYSGASATDLDNNGYLLKQLENVDEARRTARFRCVIVAMRHALDPMPQIFQGSWEGRILFEARGENGFGYDPLFYIPDLQCSAAELDSETKNRISHRGQALAQFKEALPLLTF